MAWDSEGHDAALARGKESQCPWGPGKACAMAKWEQGKVQGSKGQ